MEGLRERYARELASPLHPSFLPLFSCTTKTVRQPVLVDGMAARFASLESGDAPAVTVLGPAALVVYFKDADNSPKWVATSKIRLAEDNDGTEEEQEMLKVWRELIAKGSVVASMRFSAESIVDDPESWLCFSHLETFNLEKSRALKLVSPNPVDALLVDSWFGDGSAFLYLVENSVAPYKEVKLPKEAHNPPRKKVNESDVGYDELLKRFGPHCGVKRETMFGFRKSSYTEVEVFTLRLQMVLTGLECGPASTLERYQRQWVKHYAELIKSAGSAGKPPATPSSSSRKPSSKKREDIGDGEDSDDEPISSLLVKRSKADVAPPSKKAAIHYFADPVKKDDPIMFLHKPDPSVPESMPIAPHKPSVLLNYMLDGSLQEMVAAPPDNITYDDAGCALVDSLLGDVDESVHLPRSFVTFFREYCSKLGRPNIPPSLLHLLDPENLLEEFVAAQGRRKERNEKLQITLDDWSAHTRDTLTMMYIYQASKALHFAGWRRVQPVKRFCERLPWVLRRAKANESITKAVDYGLMSLSAPKKLEETFEVFSRRSSDFEAASRNLWLWFPLKREHVLGFLAEGPICLTNVSSNPWGVGFHLFDDLGAVLEDGYEFVMLVLANAKDLHNVDPDPLNPAAEAGSFVARGKFEVVRAEEGRHDHRKEVAGNLHALPRSTGVRAHMRSTTYVLKGWPEFVPKFLLRFSGDGAAPVVVAAPAAAAAASTEPNSKRPKLDQAQPQVQRQQQQPPKTAHTVAGKKGSDTPSTLKKSSDKLPALSSPSKLKKSADDVGESKIQKEIRREVEKIQTQRRIIKQQEPARTPTPATTAAATTTTTTTTSSSSSSSQKDVSTLLDGDNGKPQVLPPAVQLPPQQVFQPLVNEQARFNERFTSPSQRPLPPPSSARPPPQQNPPPMLPRGAATAALSTQFPTRPVTAPRPILASLPTAPRASTVPDAALVETLRALKASGPKESHHHHQQQQQQQQPDPTGGWGGPHSSSDVGAMDDEEDVDYGGLDQAASVIPLSLPGVVDAEEVQKIREEKERRGRE